MMRVITESNLNESDTITLAQHKEMIELIQKESENDMNVYKNQLAKKLSIEYKDFHSADKIKMSEDLGENFRDQLDNVFKILIKAGIPVDKK